MSKEPDSSSDLSRVALHLTEEEADAFLCLLLSAPPTDDVPEDVARRLLVLLADAQRRLARRPVQETVESDRDDFRSPSA